MSGPAQVRRRRSGQAVVTGDRTGGVICPGCGLVGGSQTDHAEGRNDRIDDLEFRRAALLADVPGRRHDLQVKLEVTQAAAERHVWPLHVIEDRGDDPAAEQPSEFLTAPPAFLAA